MDTSREEPNLEESLRQVMQTLPPVIRAYIAQGKYTTVARSLMAKYSLRIDQGGVLEKEIMLLLMGIDNPAEFTQALAEEAKLDQPVIDNITQDVNDQIFVPLREEEEKGTSGVLTPQAGKPTSPALPQAQPAIAKAESRPVPPPQGSLPPKAFLPQAATLGDVVRSVAPSAPVVAPSAAKPIEAEKLLGDHEAPHFEINKMPAPPVASRFALPHASEAPKTSIPANLPGAPRPTEVSGGGTPPQVSAPQPAPPAPAPAPAPAQPKPAPVISYSSDPYREPIDETA
ncbi:MAG: hypothetical protein ACYC48_00500 [Minisyncoccota bacterium]